MAQAGGETDISQYQEAISGGTATAGAKTKTPETKTPETKTPATTLPTLEEKEEPVAKGAMGGGWDEPEPEPEAQGGVGDFELPSLLDEASMEYLNKNKPGYQRPRGGGGRMY